MSSARSIAAARNRRAGDNSNPNPGMPSGPVKSNRFIPGPGPGQGQPRPQQMYQQQQPMYNQQQQQQQQYQQPMNQRQQSREPMIPVKSSGASGPVGQISISDAFALVTIRLGKAEQYIQQLQEAGFPDLPDIEGIGNPLDIQVINEKLNLHDQQFKNFDTKNTEMLTKLENETMEAIKIYSEDITQSLNAQLKELKETLLSQMKMYEDKIDKIIMENSANVEKINNLENFMIITQSLTTGFQEQDQEQTIFKPQLTEEELLN